MPTDLHDGEWTSLPAEVRALDRYLPWVVRPRPGGNGRVGKVPARRLGRGLYAVRADDSACWLSFDEARAEVLRGQAGGIGLCLPKDLCVVDIDDVLHDGVLTAEIRQLVQRCPTWTEVSPSGTGVHLWFTVDAPLRSGRADGLELLTSGRFNTISGRDLSGTVRTIVPLPDELSVLFKHAEPVRPALQESRTAQPNGDPDVAFSEALQRSESLRRLYLHGDASGFNSRSEADLACLQLIHRWVGPDPAVIDALFRQSALFRPKWGESAVYRERTLALVLRSGRWSR